MTSASQACGSMSFNFAVPMMEYMKAGKGRPMIGRQQIVDRLGDLGVLGKQPIIPWNTQLAKADGAPGGI
jgi:hypothetical protein